MDVRCPSRGDLQRGMANESEDTRRATRQMLADGGGKQDARIANFVQITAFARPALPSPGLIIRRRVLHFFWHQKIRRHAASACSYRLTENITVA